MPITEVNDITHRTGQLVTATNGGTVLQQITKNSFGARYLIRSSYKTALLSGLKLAQFVAPYTTVYCRPWSLHRL